MAAGHGDVELFVVVSQVPGRVEFGGVPRCLAGAAIALVTVADDGGDAAGGKIHPPQSVVFGVGQVEDIPIQGHALGMVEAGRRKIAVRQALFAGADNLGDGPI